MEEDKTLAVLNQYSFASLTYGYECWVMTEGMRPQMQASEMRFLGKIKGVTMFDKVRNSANAGIS